MKGISEIVVVIIILMISITLASFAYFFLTSVVGETTEAGRESVGMITEVMTTKFRIESMVSGTPGYIYVRNMGKTNITGLNVYVNGVLQTNVVVPSSIDPNEVETITLNDGTSPGDEIKVTGAQGYLVIETVPGATSPPMCTPDGCNANCPGGCTVLQDPDCGCQNGDGCCGMGCIPANDNDCGAVCVPDGCNANCPAGCTVAQDADFPGCQPGYGCCGIGCIPANDNDCSAPYNLVGFWAFNENSGTSAGDGSTYNNDGTLYSSGTACSNPPTYYCPHWVGGVSSSAIEFDGSNDHIRVASDPSLDITDEITVAAWVRPDPSTNYRRIVSKQYQTDTSTANSCFQLGINNDNRWRWSIVTDVSPYYYNSLANAVYNPQVGQWYHFVGTYNGSYMVMYLNGTPISTTTASGTLRVNSSEILTIANSYFSGSNGYQLPGSIDQVKIWDGALTAAEVLNEYNLYTPPGADTLWGQPTSFSSSGLSAHTSVRCMGSRAPNLPNLRIRSLHLRFNDSATAAMAIYFGGTENNPSGATRQVEILNRPVSTGWNKLSLPTELVWPANQITWICWKRSGAGYIYYNQTISFTTDFFTLVGRHDDGSLSGGPANSFNATLSTASFDKYWYEVYLTYYQT